VVGGWLSSPAGVKYVRGRRCGVNKMSDAAPVYREGMARSAEVFACISIGVEGATSANCFGLSLEVGEENGKAT